MRVEIRGQNVGLTAALEEYAMRRFTTALGRFDKRVSSVTIRFVDENGPRGGVDKKCRIEVRGPSKLAVVIEDAAADERAAIARAADRAGRTFARALERRRERR